MKPTLLIQGMHGMGDCLHQRAVLRHWMQTHDVWLETSWGSMYHDLLATGGLHLVRRPVALRTQTKNANREMAMFGGKPRGRIDETLRISYHGSNVMPTRSGTVLEAMCNVTSTPYASADFRLPVPDEWFRHLANSSAMQMWRESGKPLMIYRPLVSRPEWKGSAARNADPKSYAKLIASVRDEFFVISVADLEPNREWIVGPKFQADVEFHKGELDFETLAALFSLADVVWCSSGFAAILAPAVGTPVVSIVGGYEHHAAHNSGERFAPMISIGPADGPCKCWSSQCQVRCNKEIDLDSAIPAVRQFLSQVCIQIRDTAPAGQRDWQAMHGPNALEINPPLATPFLPPRNSPQYALYLQAQRALARRQNPGQSA